jgi:hypothetical protein
MIPDPVAGALGAHPQLEEALLTYVQRLASPDRALALFGSVARGSADRFSDLDLALWAGPGENPDDLADTAWTVAAGIGRTLVIFRGTHVNRPNLVVAYSELHGTVVKTDIDVLPADEPPAFDSMLVLFGRPPLPAVAESSAPALADALTKAAGWTWFTYAKIIRGENFAAARSIDFTREHALLPALLWQHHLPQDGHRHLEDRLPEDILFRLRRTYPVALTTGELLRAFHELTEYVCVVAAELSDQVCGTSAGIALHRVNDLIAADIDQHPLASPRLEV